MRLRGHQNSAQYIERASRRLKSEATAGCKVMEELLQDDKSYYIAGSRMGIIARWRKDNRAVYENRAFEPRKDIVKHTEVKLQRDSYQTKATLSLSARKSLSGGRSNQPRSMTHWQTTRGLELICASPRD